MSKQDRVYTRTPAALEQKYDWGKTFAEVYGLINDAQNAAEKANNAVDGLDKKLDHEEIFNRLTNYGTVQGIYRSENDDIYINASYIKSGKLAADRIDADNLKVKAANITGELTIGQLPSGIVTETNVTTIVGGIVTTDYVNALGISVSAAKITGTLTADQVVLTGSISWSDLDSGVQSSINSAGGISASYAKTLITETLVASPNIIGASIYGGSFMDLNGNSRLVLNPSGSSSSNADLFLYSGNNVALRLYDNITGSIEWSSFSDHFLTTGTWGTKAFGDWSFAGANVTGVTATFG